MAGEGRARGAITAGVEWLSRTSRKLIPGRLNPEDGPGRTTVRAERRPIRLWGEVALQVKWPVMVGHAGIEPAT